MKWRFIKCDECEDGTIYEYYEHQLCNKYQCFKCAGHGYMSLPYWIRQVFWMHVAPGWLFDLIADSRERRV